jgi:lipopolysaccharide/colanic/teichoic acid biosynthesis glycosyltransferase
VIVSLLLLLLTAPIILIFAALVKLDSKGPAFFRQRASAFMARISM